MARSAPIRSFLFVPGDSPRKMAKALGAGADAVILDLEDAVAPATKAAARAQVADFLAAQRHDHAPFIWVRINPLSQPDAVADLGAVVQPALSGIVVPKIDGPDDVGDLSRQLDGLERRAGLPAGRVRILAVATETAQSLFRLGDYRAVNARLHGLTWGAEDLAASLGASTNRTPDGSFALPYELARTLCLAGARAAGVVPVETAVMDFRNTEAVFRIASTAGRTVFLA